MKIALIGLGHIARFQLKALSQINEVELVSAHDIDPAQAEILPDDIPFFSDLDGLLNDGEADIAMVSTPNVTHYEIGKRVLESGSALLLEKPCCNTEEEIDDLIDTARRSGQFFSVALHAACARDLIWYLEQVRFGEIDLGPLTSFYAGFFDPYYREGKIVPGAQGLGGSWFDSGINALSVIGRLIPPERLDLVDGRMTTIDTLDCSEVQGAATFTYPHRDFTGHGIIDTNWTLGLNQKTTRLYYGSTNAEVLLHHSNEEILITRDGEVVLEKNFQGEFTRLTNHYINLFRDIEQRLSSGEDNIEHAAELHRLLFAAISSS
jgi:D-galactose 1-dehydrogenase